MSTMKEGVFVTHKSGEVMFVYKVNGNNLCQMIRKDGSKFSGTPGLDKLQALGYRVKAYRFNGAIYYKLELGWVSGSTGIIMKDSFVKDILRLGQRIQ